MKKNLWMMAAMLICGVMMTLTSCSKDDDKNEPKLVSPGPMAEKVSGGAWYDVYEASGTAKEEGSSDAETVSYSVVIDIYNFRADGTGDFQRCFFNDESEEPVMVHGILGYGVFTYSSATDGTVAITLSNNWDQSYPQKWNVTYGNETITAKGVDGQTLTLVRADDETMAILNSFLEQNGGSDNPKYNVDDYKPMDVDNSQWMKGLADSRLVADLSLPGSHDACTADGWFYKDLGKIAEVSAKTQDLTIKEQLKVGMRVFDLRPERMHDGANYVLRCSHGIMYTKLLVSDFFQQLKEFLAANPSEFLLLTIDLSATSDKTAWGKEFTELVNSAEFRSMFADFKPRLTVGEMRGHVLMLSCQKYAEQPVGGYCNGWISEKGHKELMKGNITGADGVETPLWVQDFWGKWDREGKDEAVVSTLEASVGRDLTAEKPAWVINFPSAYFGLPLSDSYRDNAVKANKVAADWLANHTGSVGIIYMDFAGMEKSPSSFAETLYETYGMTLVDRVIQQNQKK